LHCLLFSYFSSLLLQLVPMFGFSSKKQDVNLRIETCSSCGKFQKHAEQSSKLIESWLDPKQFTLKTTINAGDSKHVDAFEVSVNGYLVHSEQQRNHGYLDSHPDDEHKEAVRMAIQEIIAGHRAIMPDKQENSEIKLDKQKQRQQKENIAMKKRELEEAHKSKQREEVLKKTNKADEKKRAQKEEAKLKKAVAAKEKKQKEATAKRSAQDFRREEAQKRTEEIKEKAEAAMVEAQRAQEEVQALAEASGAEELTAQEEASREEAQKNNAEAEEKAEAESLRVDVEADGERDGDVQALAKALAAEETMAHTQTRFDQASSDPASINLAATLPFTADDRGASCKSLQTPRTTAGNSLNSSWEAPSETEQKPLIQNGSKENFLATSQAAAAQPSTGLAMLFGFACCRSSSTLEDSAGDIPAASA